MILKNLIVNEEYCRKLAELNTLKDKERNLEIDKLNCKVGKNFSFKNIFNIYDFSSGSVYFSDNSWILYKNNELKKIFSEKEGQSYKYILPTDEGYLLRGVFTYYLPLATQKRMGITEKWEVNSWKKENINFLKKIRKTLPEFEVTDSDDIKMILAILDNIRNIHLIILNTQVLMDNNFDPFLKNIDEYECVDNNILIYDFIFNLCIKNDNINYYNYYVKKILLNILDFTIKEVLLTMDKLIEFFDSDYYPRCLKIHREIDNFWENYISLNHFIKENKIEGDFNAIGVSYGGIELPIMLKWLKLDNNIHPYLISYRNRHHTIEKYQLTNFPFENNLFSSKTIVLDDNIMSGKTLQDVQIILSNNKVEIFDFFVVRQLNINRVNQLIDTEMVPDLNISNTIIKGMLFPSPYSKVKPHTNFQGEFLDETKIFTLTGSKIVRFILKNGLFLKDSEVKMISGFIEGQERRDNVWRS